mmetsp:Transcript_66036/g.177594  ORF Transcript_66036/g.177594 Transcript_66036/m.177594 type:complete len:205 (+) Transcript_66036:436-1050(+)
MRSLSTAKRPACSGCQSCHAVGLPWTPSQWVARSTWRRSGDQHGMSFSKVALRGVTSSCATACPWTVRRSPSSSRAPAWSRPGLSTSSRTASSGCRFPSGWASAGTRPMLLRSRSSGLVGSLATPLRKAAPCSSSLAWTPEPRTLLRRGRRHRPAPRRPWAPSPRPKADRRAPADLGAPSAASARRAARPTRLEAHGTRTASGR